MKIYVQFKNKQDPMSSDIDSYTFNNSVLALLIGDTNVVIPRENVDYFTLINEKEKEEVITDA